MTTKVELDYSVPEVRANPYPIYEQMRAEDPFYRSKEGVYYLTRHDHVVKILMDKERTSRRPWWHIIGGGRDQYAKDDINYMVSNWLILQDPPVHSTMRNYVAKTINPKAIKAKASTVEAIARKALDDLKGREQFDIVSEYAFHLTMGVLCDLSGLSVDDIGFTKEWGDKLTIDMDDGVPEDIARFNVMVPKLREFFSERAEYYRKHPADNWINQILVNNQEREEPLDETDLIDSMVFLVFSGHETTRLGISLCFYGLLSHPEAQQELRDHPELIDDATEELLRYESPLNKVSRWTTEAIELDGETIPENSLVVCLINAANRDPALFPQPNELNFYRNNMNQSASFGKGIHTCLGNVLGRLESKIAIKCALETFPKLSIVPGGVKWGETTGMRYISELRVSTC